MNILGLDTVASACSVAWWRDGQIVARQCRAMTRGHAEALMPMVETTAAAAWPDDPRPLRHLNLIAVTIGPGAFTGLRIGLATAHGLAIAVGAGLAGINTLGAWAAKAGAVAKGAEVLVILETKRDDVYWQLFDRHLQPHGAPATAFPAQLVHIAENQPNAVMVGDASVRVAAAARDGKLSARILELAAPEAADVAALAATRWRAGAPPGPAVPLYLRPPDVT